AHPGLELSGIFLLHLAELFLGQNFLLLQTGNFARIDANEGFEVENVLEVAHRDVEKIPDAAGQALEEPHVRAWRSQLDMAEAFAADFAERHFDAALIANHSAMLHPLVFSAQALPVRDGAKNLGAEQAVALRLEGTVIDGLRLGDFAVRPRPDFFWTRQADPDRVEICNLAGAVVRTRSIQWLTLLPDETREKFKKLVGAPAMICGSAKLIRRFGLLELGLLPLHQFNVEAERLQLAHKNVEGFRHARFDSRLA